MRDDGQEQGLGNQFGLTTLLLGLKIKIETISKLVWWKIDGPKVLSNLLNLNSFLDMFKICQIKKK